MSVNLSQLTVSELLVGFLKSLPKDQHELFIRKIIGERPSGIEDLLLYIKNPKKYLHVEKESTYSIGDTIYFEPGIHYGSTLEKEIKLGNVIDKLLVPATILDFEFFPDPRIIVRLHGRDKKDRLSTIHSYIKPLDLV